MSRAAVVVVFAAALSLVGAAAPRAVSACTCPRVRPGPESLDRADVVFLGRVIAALPDRDRAPRGPVTFEVLEVFKGELPRRVRVDPGGTSCGIRRWRRGERWVVFATRDGERLRTRQCTGTARLARAGRPLSEEARRILESLGRSRSPVDSSPQTRPASAPLPSPEAR